MKAQTGNTVDTDEIAHFSQMAEEWWDPEGKLRPLHRINPLRVQWIIEKAQPAGRRLLDIGCGGGLVCEPMARAGAQVTGIDASEKNIAVAHAHAENAGLTIDYRCLPAEELLAAGERYDIVLALEIIEHVADVEAFIAAACGLLKPGGVIIYSTLNRTAKAFALGIVAAEYMLGWVPRGTHRWGKFLKPSELCDQLRRHGVTVTDMTGLVLNPLSFTWELREKDVSVNYLLAGRKAA